MTTVNRTTNQPSSVNVQPEVPSKNAGETITADTFRQMVDVLDALIQHNHTFRDDYTSNCQCNCGRGSL